MRFENRKLRVWLGLCAACSTSSAHTWPACCCFSRTSGTSLYPWTSLAVGTRTKLTTICLFIFFSEKEYSGRTRWEELLWSVFWMAFRTRFKIRFFPPCKYYHCSTWTVPEKKARLLALKPDAHPGRSPREGWEQSTAGSCHLHSPSAWGSRRHCFQGYIDTIAKIKC